MIVDRVVNLLLVKLVSFSAPVTERCEWQTMARGQLLQFVQHTLKVQAGDYFTVPYPGWSKLEVGQTVELETIRRNPFAPRGRTAIL